MRSIYNHVARELMVDPTAPTCTAPHTPSPDATEPPVRERRRPCLLLRPGQEAPDLEDSPNATRGRARWWSGRGGARRVGCSTCRPAVTAWWSSPVRVLSW